MKLPKKQKIYSVRDDDQDVRFLSYDADETDDARLASPDEMGSEALCELMDQDAENGNHHALCGAHAILHKLLSKDTDTKDAADAVIRVIAERGGLHGLAE